MEQKLESNLKLKNKIILRTNTNHILTSTITGILNSKNNHDHIALKNNCIKNNFLVSENVLKAEIDIKRYKVGHTIPKIYPGGLSEDLFNS